MKPTVFTHGKHSVKILNNGVPNRRGHYFMLHLGVPRNVAGGQAMPELKGADRDADVLVEHDHEGRAVCPASPAYDSVVFQALNAIEGCKLHERRQKNRDWI